LKIFHCEVPVEGSVMLATLTVLVPLVWPSATPMVPLVANWSVPTPLKVQPPLVVARSKLPTEYVLLTAGWPVVGVLVKYPMSELPGATLPYQFVATVKSVPVPMSALLLWLPPLHVMMAAGRVRDEQRHSAPIKVTPIRKVRVRVFIFSSGF